MADFGWTRDQVLETECEFIFAFFEKLAEVRNVKPTRGGQGQSTANKYETATWEERIDKNTKVIHQTFSAKDILDGKVGFVNRTARKR